MKAAAVREAFLDYFKKHGHEVCASSSLVPSNDPTLLFTNAGMVQFKDVFTGVEQRGSRQRRATTSQKCVRAGGKHNDLDEVGKTPRHHTFFEMLGNFSFGDYFKEDAIAFAWELLTKVYDVDTSRMCVTVYGGDKELAGVTPDDEARAIWKKVTGFSDERVIGLGKKDNFWMMGDTGPMGPCTEIHYNSSAQSNLAWPTQDPESWKGWLEIWNLVFMQFERREKDGPLHPLPAPSVDTGAGLERVTSVVQGVASNYDTDLFTGILETTAELAGKKYGANPDQDTSMRVIADHARCATFLIGDGVFPDKTGREYVLRRIFRRAVRHGKLLGIEKPFMHEVCARVISEMSGQYPDLVERASTIKDRALEEEKLFRRTLERGLGMLDTEFGRMAKTGEKEVPGEKVFALYDTHGFPDDLTEIVANERGFGIDKAGFEAELEKARKLSSFGGSGQEIQNAVLQRLAQTLPATRFLGYDTTSASGKVLWLVVDDNKVLRTADGAAGEGSSVHFVLDETPFYAESGGQVGDRGEVTTDDGTVLIEDTQKFGSVYVLTGVVTRGTIKVGDKVTSVVDDPKRDQTRANHSATHLLNHALKHVLGDHVAQKGSLVSPDRLRFDFAHRSPMTEDEKRQVEDLVNADIRSNKDSVVEVLPIEQAKQKGAVAMFGEKYGDTVRVVHIGNESLEFCGGTHVRRAGDIGLFKIVSEQGVAQGVRRIEAVTGINALDYLRKLETELGAIGGKFKVAPLEASARVDKLIATTKTLEREIATLKQKIASGGGGRDLMSEVQTVKGIKVLAAAVDVDDVKVLRDTGDQLRDKLGSGVVVLAGIGGTEVKLVAMVTKDLVDKVQAGKLLSEVAARLGGKAGGKPDSAQGGGKDASAVPQALELARSWVEQHA